MFLDRMVGMMYLYQLKTMSAVFSGFLKNFEISRNATFLKTSRLSTKVPKSYRIVLYMLIGVILDAESISGIRFELGPIFQKSALRVAAPP